jgi:hypothetical protein
MLEDALKTLSNPPSIGAKKQALAEIHAKIVFLESRLGIRHGMFQFNSTKAVARLAELESQLAAKGATLAPAAAPAPDSRPVELTGNGATDKAIQASGCRSLAQYKAKAQRDRLFATAANLPPGSVARQCAESNLAAAQRELANA